MKMKMRPTPPMFPLMPLVPMGAMATVAATSVATWRRLRRLEHRLSPPGTAGRSTREVLDDHFEQVQGGDLEADLARNYDPQVVLLTSFGSHHGHDGLRTLIQRLLEQAPDPAFDYHDVQVDGDVGFLRWSGRGSDGTRLVDGAESYVVRHGRIVAQTIHYRVEDGSA
jgi:ketosteroid isomerase-like protein